ncbi:alkane hydroxylase MAH1-like [Impatiens glandulifera]|uniref:alkane hydroxylase MAH1-like n=1 Tax=Impatiens glandulifera TaxID=253017 RepID=UPI001FB19550|nr:alkane hydroxylase MAH1-like [Impatiens glandulifera]
MAFLSPFEMILAILGFFIVFFYSFRRTDSFPTNWPFLGMLPGLLAFVDSIHERTANLLGLTGGTFVFKGPWFINMDMVNTADPANVHHIMSSNFSNFPKGPEFLKIFDVLGDGIFNSDEEMWKRQRKLARVLINHNRFKKYLFDTSRKKVSDGIVVFLKNAAKLGLVVDLQDMFQRYTFDTTCVLITGYDPGCLSTDLPEVPFATALDNAEEAIFRRHVIPKSIWKLQKLFNVGYEKKLKEAWVTLDEITNKYITMKREELEKKKGNIASIEKEEEEDEGADLLTSYMNEDETTSVGLEPDDKFLRDTIINLMLAGRDTTSSALTWFIWMVSQHPKIAKRIREELTTILNPKDVERQHLFTIDEVSKLPYLHGALCEALRLYPPVPIQHKEPIQPDTLPSGIKVKPGMKIVISMYAMGRMKFIWGDDCLEFKPERWFTEKGTIKHEPSYKFFAFNAGPRTCLGKDVAFTQMKTVGATIIHNFSVEVIEGHVVEPNVSIILYMKHGLKARISQRWS